MNTKDKSKAPNYEGLKKAVEELEKAYKKHPSNELLDIISKIGENEANSQVDDDRDDIAASSYDNHSPL